MEDKISIILEAVERAKGVLNKTIADIEKLDASNKKSESTWQRLNDVLQQHDRILLGIKVGAAAVIAATVLMAKSAIHTADAYNVMAQAAGTSVETLSTLVFAAGQANVQVNELVIGMKQLQIAAVNASQGSAEQAAAFQALGVSVRNADGSLKSSTELLFAVSDAFARFADGPAKATVAQRLFGRSSQELIGFLNQGSVAIKQQQEQAKALGLEISTNTAKAADQFSDNMNALKGILQGMANQMVAQLLPTLLALQKFFLDNPALVKALATAIVALSAAVVLGTVAWKAYAIAGNLAAASLGVGAVKNARDYLAAIQLISTTSFAAYTVGIASAVAVIYAGVEGWKAWKAAQQEAISTDNLQSQQQRFTKSLAKMVDDLKEAGKISATEADSIKRHLEDSLKFGSNQEITDTQQLVRNRIRVINGGNPVHPGEKARQAAAANGSEQLTVPDTALEKAKVDANTKLFQASIDARVQDFANGQAREQAALDDALKRRTISLTDWRTQQLAIEQKAADESKRIEDFKFTVEQENIKKTLALSSDPKEKVALQAQEEALEISHQSRMETIAAESAEKRLAIDRQYFDNRAALVQENLQAVQNREAGAAADFQSRLDEIQIGEQRGEFVNVFEEINKAKEEYLAKLAREQEALAAILDEMEAINAEQPGTFSEKDKASAAKAVEDNQKQQVAAEQKTTDQRRSLQAKQLQGTQDMFGNMATAAKAFGKQGFAVYKGLAIAQAVVNTASAAIGAYNSVVGIPYVGPILAPIAAAAAIAAGAAQISVISAEKFAGGGLITGPGGGTEDKVPIFASNGEFMVRESVTGQPGALEFLRNFNMMGMEALDAPVAAQATRAPRFADGGLVEDATGGRGRGRNGGLVLNLGFLDERQQERDFMQKDGARITMSRMRKSGASVPV